TDSLALTQPQKKLFEHLAYDIKYALKGLSADELFVLIRDASIISAKITYETKKYSLKKTVKFLDNTINRYKQEGVLNSLKADTEKLQDFLVRVPGNARMLYENFLSLN